MKIAYYLEADDRLLTPWFVVGGKYEINLTRFFTRNIQPDSVCIDVGANFGYFTCLMARLCHKGKVISIEADAHIYELMRDNAFINGNSNVTPIHAAAGEGHGEATLFRRQSRSGNTSMIFMGDEFTASLGELPEVPFTVKTVSIDDLVATHTNKVDFIKIDVEGAEPLVLKGAEKTIAANPQVKIVMEWSPGQIKCAGFDIEEFCRHIHGYGLRPFDIKSYRLVPLSFDELAELPYRAGIVLTR